MAKQITPRKQNFSQWYNELVVRAGLAESSSVRGCMVIKPYGFSIWEKMQSILDKKFKDTGHSNAYFPLFIPKSYFTKEAKHVDGFAKECAIVTHYKLKNDDETGNIVTDPNSKLEEELIVRPTSETIIWNTYKNWVQSYRDLPLLINQWANVVRWEMRTRLFLRTSEFLWQEGHTAHATKEEAKEETEKILSIYEDFFVNTLGIPVVCGRKSQSERFAGAEDTLCVEALMQDGKALQAGTSHFLGQNFAKAFDVKFANKEGKEEYVWATSWGVSTRMIGGLIMAHSDDDGLVLPPAIAPIQVVIVPVFKSDDDLKTIDKAVEKIIHKFKEKDISFKYDNDNNRKPGWKFSEYEMQGVPLRITVGIRDLEKGQIEIARRDTKEKCNIKIENVISEVEKLQKDIQQSIYQKALSFREANTRNAENYDEFKTIIKNKGGFVEVYWDGSLETEQQIKTETKATIRCLPFSQEISKQKCFFSGKPAKYKALFAKAY